MSPLAELDVAAAELPAWACVAGVVRAVLFAVSLTLLFVG